MYWFFVSVECSFTILYALVRRMPGGMVFYEDGIK